jgi:hypothetical protein
MANQDRRVTVGPLMWSVAARRTEWGADMLVATVGLTKDNTLDLYCERDMTPLVDAMFAEIDRRKGDPSTRLHNLCEAIAEEADGSEFSREEWERIDAENVKLRASKADLLAALTMLLDEYHGVIDPDRNGLQGFDQYEEVVAARAAIAKASA